MYQQKRMNLGRFFTKDRPKIIFCRHALGRSVSTIGRELKRNYGYGARSYNGERAQELAEQHRVDSKEPLISEKIWAVVFRLHKADWSPEQISEVLKLQGISISHETIYRRIYAEIEAGRLERNCKGAFFKKFPYNITL